VNDITVAEALAQLSVTRLAHFTPARNLWHIFQDGQIRSSKDLADNAPEYFDPTDRERFDQNPDKVCCSFEYPNGYYLSQARRKPGIVNYPGWACLLLDPELVLRPGTLFCPCNAARGRGCYIRGGGQALLDCFASPARPDNRWVRGGAHHPAAATDLQAEVLVPGPIDLSHLKGIVMPTDADAASLFGTLSRYGFTPGRFRWIVAPIFFDRDALANRVRFGGAISETEWVPSADQEPA
jgi:hypothetical protein